MSELHRNLQLPPITRAMLFLEVPGAAGLGDGLKVQVCDILRASPERVDRAAQRLHQSPMHAGKLARTAMPYYALPYALAALLAMFL